MDDALTEATKNYWHALLQACGEDSSREGLVKTPQRFLKAFEELTSGYHHTLKEVVNDALFPCDNSNPIYIQDIPFFSLCEHHVLPFYGTCTIAYIPNGTVLGLSKVYRIIALYAQRLQLQEQLTQQIGEAIQSVTHAKGVQVDMHGTHLCVAMRGVKQSQSFMHTHYRNGEAIPPSTKQVTSEPTCSLYCTSQWIPLFIGCTEEEQKQPTPIQLSLQLRTPVEYGTRKDDLSTTVDYDALMLGIKHACLNQRFRLIEFAGQTIYQWVHKYLADHYQDMPIKITLQKRLSHSWLQDSQFVIGDF